MSPPFPAGDLILTGMPGSGKTAIGRVLAERLGRTLVDLDERVATAAGRSVAEIIAADGETAFRARERAATLALAAGTTPRVIATGGGTLLDELSRLHLLALGTVICLTATAEELARRLQAAPGSRPLLREPDSATVAALLARRRRAYDSVPLQVETTRREVADVASAVLDLVATAGDAPWSAVPVATPTGGYGVLVGTGLLAAAGPVLAARGIQGRILVVSDTTVAHLYGASLAQSLAAAGLQASAVAVRPGEQAKSLDEVARLYEACHETDLDRHGTIIALGGGVISDLGGFVAATWLRGVRHVVVPTTLLGMVDAAIGGKTGVNLATGKNLVGSFHHPAVVLADPGTLATLPPETLRGGLAELAKQALVGDPGLWFELGHGGSPAADDLNAWQSFITRAAWVKADIVSEDAHEHGRRAVLNLGHTFAHAFERATGYVLPHGQAVSVGLAAAARLAERLGLAVPGLTAEVAAQLAGLGLPVNLTGTGLEPGVVLAAMATDKKRRAGRLRFVLPLAVGDVRVVPDVPESAVLAVLAEVLG